MDVYLVACLVFIFLSLIKMALVKYMLSRAKRSDNKVDPIVEMSSPTVDKSSVELAKSSSNGQIVALPEHNLEAPAPTNLSLRKKEKNTKAWRFMQGFHLSSQLVLPLAFLAFLIFFFAIYPFTIETEGCY